MEQNWVDSLIGETALNPLSKQPEIVKEAFVLEADAAAFQDVDEQLSACKQRKSQIEESVRSGNTTPGEREELIELNHEINELLDYRNLKRKEIYTPHLAATNLSDAEKEAAIQEYPKLADTCSDVKAALQVLFPAMAEEDYKMVKAAYWETVFNGPMMHRADLEGMYEVGAFQLGTILDDVMTCEGNKEEFLERMHGITNAELKEEILARSVVAITTSDDMTHRDPEEKFQDPHLQQSGPHTSGPGMVEMADATSQPSWPSIMSMPGEDIRELPTISQGQFDNLKFDDGKHRVWVSRMTQEDGAEFDHEVYVEILQNGVWRRASKKAKAKMVEGPDGQRWWMDEFTGVMVPMKDTPPIENAFSTSDFGYEPAWTVQESPAPMPNTPAPAPVAPKPAPKQEAPAPAPAPEQAAPSPAPSPDKPDEEALQEMVDLRVEWKMLSESIEEHVSAFREMLIEEMAKSAPLTSNPIEMKKMVKDQEPALKNALAMVDGMARVSQGFKVFLQQVSGSIRFQYGNAWKTLKENAARITEAGTMADQRIYNAMTEMEKIQSMYTYVKPTENIGIIPEKENKPSRVKKSETALNWSGISVEAEPITQKLKEYYARFTDWCKRTLLPLLTGATKSFESLQESMDTVTSSSTMK